MNFSKKLLFLAAPLSAIAGACSSDSFTEPQTPNANDSHLPCHRVTLRNAISNAEKYLEIIEGYQTRGSRIPSSVQIIGSKIHTRAADKSDTLLYIVNFSNDSGFAVLGADDRMMPVYAISESGHLNLNDTTFNAGLATFFRLVTAEAETIVASDNDFGVIIPPPFVPDTTLTADTTSQISTPKVKVGPFLKGKAPLWRQSYPFSALIPQIDGKYVQAGCSAIAIAQALCAMETPYNNIIYPSYSIDWDIATNYIGGINDGGLLRLIEVLGRPENLNMEYGIASSSPHANSLKAILNTFDNFNISAQYSFKPNHKTNFWLNDRVEASILRGVPVVVLSDIEKYTNLDGSGEVIRSSHLWIIDGMLYTPDLREKPDPVYGTQDQLFHCVWGWGGMSNGYFAIRAQELLGATRIPDDEDYGSKLHNCDNLWHIILNHK